MTFRSLACIAAILAALLMTPSLSRADFDGWIRTPIQEFQLLVVITRDVVCRAQPGRSNLQVESLELGQVLRVEESQEIGDEIWYRAERILPLRQACWVYGPLTTPFDRDEPGIALLAVVDYALAQGREAEFEDYVAVENLILDPSFRFDLDTSPILQLRLLEVIDRAAGRIDSRRIRFSPLRRSWLLAHQERLGYFEPGAFWHVERGSFWELYETHGDSPAADEIAWVASRRGVGGDCEGHPDCVLAMVIDGPMQYWSRLPAGAWIQESLERARELVMMAVNTACNSEDYAVTKDIVDRVHESLRQVRVEEAEELVEALARASRECSKTGA